MSRIGPRAWGGFPNPPHLNPEPADIDGGAEMGKSRRTVITAFMVLTVTAVACSGAPSNPAELSGQTPEAALHVGDPAPAFTLMSASGAPVSLETLLGHRPALLFFSMGPG